MKELLEENLELRDIANEMKLEIEYSKQRENKLMFFLYLMKERGHPVQKIFEEDIKDIPTSRFSKTFDESYKEIYDECQQRKAIKEYEKRL